MERTQAYRNVEVFEDFLLACEADFRGRTGFEERDYPQRRLLQKIRLETQNVDASLFLEKQLSGRQIGEHIHQYRVNLTKAILKQAQEELA